MVRDHEAGRIGAADFWQRVANIGSPLVTADPESTNHRRVTFVWTLDPASRHVVLQAGGFPDPADHVLHEIAGTRTRFATYRFRCDVVMRYAFVPDLPPRRWWTANANHSDELNRFLRDNQTRADPFNRHRVAVGGLARDGHQSLLELDGAHDDRWLREPPRRGRLDTASFASRRLANERNVRLYRPASFEERPIERVLVVLDGEWYSSLVPTPTILDNLHAAGAIPATLAVLVENVDRDRELPCNDDFADALALELAPWIRSRYDVPADPACWAIVGSSFGGLGAIWAAHRHPDFCRVVIGSAAALSWDWRASSPYSYVAMRAAGHSFDRVHRAFRDSALRPLRFWLDVGLMDDFDISIEPNRRFAEILETKGYAVDYHEDPGGHDFVLWRKTLPNALIEMLN